MDPFILALLGLALFVAGGAGLAWVDFFRVRRLRADLARAVARIARLEAPPEPATPPPPPERRAPPPPPREARAFARLERAFADRWSLVAGALALAIAGVFLVRHSLDRGWLGPEARCAAGAAGGVLLALAGEALRRRARRREDAAAVPAAAALVAAGVSMLFVSLYAAHALYGLLPRAPAFVLLAGAAGGAVALALLHGPFIAVLGVVGGYLTPALVAEGTPSAPALFAFLAALTAAAAGIARYRRWPRIGRLALAGAALWPALWLATAWRPGDAPAVGAYLCLALALFLYLPPRAADPPGWARFAIAPPAAATALFAPLFFALVRVDGHGPASLAALAAACLVWLDAGHRRGGLADLFGAAALAVVLALAAAFHIDSVTDAAGNALGVEGWRYDLGRIAVAPALVPFLAFAAGFAALFAAAGFARLWRAGRPWVWAGLSAAAPVALLAIAFWRVREFRVDFAWAAVAAGVAALQILAAERLARRRDRPGLDGALAAYALGAAAALALAFALSLQQAWLTVALALQVAALAAIHDRLPLPGLRLAALATAAAVIARLAINPRVLDYAAAAPPGFGWMLYGYGVPALAFLWAARRFGAARRDLLVTALEAGALAFGVLLASLQIHQWMAGAVDSADFGFAERASQTAAWLAIAWGLYRAGGGRSGVADRGWQVLGAAALAHLFVVQVVAFGPLTHPVDVGDRPILNLLALAYGVPAAFALAFLHVSRGRSGRADRAAGRVAGAAAVALLFVWLTMEVRRAFQGGVLAGGEIAGDAERFAYSLAWLAAAGLLLALGLRRGSAALRRAALAAIAVTAAKLVLFDMAALTGLWRVASFLGLGLSLVGLGYLYRRFVFSRPPPAPGSKT